MLLCASGKLRLRKGLAVRFCFFHTGRGLGSFFNAGRGPVSLWSLREHERLRVDQHHARGAIAQSKPPQAPSKVARWSCRGRRRSGSKALLLQGP